MCYVYTVKYRYKQKVNLEQRAELEDERSSSLFLRENPEPRLR